MVQYEQLSAKKGVFLSLAHPSGREWMIPMGRKRDRSTISLGGHWADIVGRHKPASDRTNIPTSMSQLKPIGLLLVDHNYYEK